MCIKITRSHFWCLTMYQDGMWIFSTANSRGVSCIGTAIKFLNEYHPDHSADFWYDRWLFHAKKKMMLIILIVVHWVLNWNEKRTTKALDNLNSQK